VPDARSILANRFASSVRLAVRPPSRDTSPFAGEARADLPRQLDMLKKPLKRRKKLPKKTMDRPLGLA
jgi:hypothetical protein